MFLREGMLWFDFKILYLGLGIECMVLVGGVVLGGFLEYRISLKEVGCW